MSASDPEQVTQADVDYVQSLLDNRKGAWRSKVMRALIAIQARRSAAPADLWRPIKTAPKDGTVILLGFPVVGNLREEDRRVYEGRWHEQQETFTSVNGFLLLTAASHWQPLPLPPGDGADATS